MPPVSKRLALGIGAVVLLMGLGAWFAARQRAEERARIDSVTREATEAQTLARRALGADGGPSSASSTLRP